MSEFENRCRLIALGRVLLITTLLAGCGNPGEQNASGTGGSGARVTDADVTPTSTNRVAIPASVRSNLGISFVTVERRRIENTLRVPGRFEYLPTARREYRTMLPGRVELHAGQFDVVEPGALLYRIDSPRWRAMQQEIAEAQSSIERYETKLATFGPLRQAHERHEASLQDTIDVWMERVTQLESLSIAGGGQAGALAEARAELASLRANQADVEEKDAALDASEAEFLAELAAATSRHHFLLNAASAVVGLSQEALTATQTVDGTTRPAWSTIESIDVRATEAGVVETLGLTNGSWADEKSTVMAIVKPDQLRFRASALQSDLGVLKDGLNARIVPPTPTLAGRAVPLQETMSGTITLGLAADAADRTIDLYVTPASLKDWARPGVSAQLEIVTDSSAREELAIPLAAVQRDGLNPVIFRRAPDNGNEAIRIEGDLGADDGRWVEVMSGLRDGDQVVLDGAFQLMLATSGSIQKGGHFHADGTFHEGEH